MVHGVSTTIRYSGFFPEKVLFCYTKNDLFLNEASASGLIESVHDDRLITKHISTAKWLNVEKNNTEKLNVISVYASHTMLCRPAISSMSLGRAWVHDLPTKLLQAQRYNLEGIELFHEDLQYAAKALPSGITRENEVRAAYSIRQLCDKYSLKIICLQPFWRDEGLRDETERTSRIAELRFRLQLAQILHTSLVLIPSSILPANLLNSDLEVLVADLQEVAELGAQKNPVINFAYESLCWGTNVDTWEACWEIVTRVDRPNFGICLDTFNIAGRVYADPASLTGKTPHAEADVQASIDRLVHTVDVEKVFLVQIVDAERLEDPLVEGHSYYNSEQPARMSWSRNCRLFYGEKERGAYLPVKEVARAIFQGLGFRGWVSMELFNRTLAIPDPKIPAEHAWRAAESWKKLVKDCDIETRQDSGFWED